MCSVVELGDHFVQKRIKTNKNAREGIRLMAPKGT